MSESHLRALSARLLSACKEGCLPTVRSIAPDLYDPISRSLSVAPLSVALATAAEHGHAQVLSYLLSLPACVASDPPWCPDFPHPQDDLPQQGWAGAGLECYVPLRAASSGNPSVMQVLLDKGLHVNEVTEPAGPPLAVAVLRQSLEMVRFLLDNGADPNACLTIPRGPLLASAACRPSQEIVTALLDRGARMDGSNALHAAAVVGNCDMARLLLDRGMDVNSIRYIFGGSKPEDSAGTALHMAAQAGKNDMVEFLLSRGADRNIRNGQGKTARDGADERQKADIVQILDQATD